MSMQVDIPSIKLNSGYEIPLIGLGTWKSGKNEVYQAVKWAIELGYRHIDCAAVYENEDEVGRAFKEIFDEGKIKREDIFITSKTILPGYETYEKIEARCKKSLNDLNIDYLDLYLIHWPFTGNIGPEIEPPLITFWEAMEKLVDKGYVKTIGVSNYSIKKINDILNMCRIKPAVNQVEIHPYFRNDELIEYCKNKDIHVSAYSPFGSPDSADIFNRYNSPKLFENETIRKISKSLGKTEAQILLKWGLQHGTSILPKSVNKERIKMNIDLFNWEIPEKEYKEISSFEIQLRMLDGNFIINSKGPFKSLMDVWDDPEEENRIRKYTKQFYQLKEIKLKTNIPIPMVGYKITEKTNKIDIINVMRCGYRYLNINGHYDNLKDIGLGINHVIRERIINRNEIIISVKFNQTLYCNAENIENEINDICEKLKIEYIDILVLQNELNNNLINDMKLIWQSMENLIEKDIIKNIGICDFNVSDIEKLLLMAKKKPYVIQMELHPFNNDVNLKKLINYCREKNIMVIAYYLNKGDKEFMNGIHIDINDSINEKIKEIMVKYNKNINQILKYWAYHNDYIILSSTYYKNIEENFDMESWQMEDGDFKYLNSLKNT